MKISIITVAYNSSKTIRDAMDSILNQDYNNIEYIVIDGKSQDDTATILKDYQLKFGGRMKYVSESDNGIYDAMNKGINLVTGDIVGILNSDDFYKSNHVLSTVVHYFRETNCDGVYGDLEFISEQDINKVVRNWKSSPYEKGSFLRGWHPPHPTFFVKREFYKKYGGFDTSLNVSADFELMLRFIEKHEIRVNYIPQTLVSMRYGGESTSSLKKIIRGNRNILKAFKKNGFSINQLTYLRLRIMPKIRQISSQHLKPKRVEK